jgi:hypothetical protein
LAPLAEFCDLESVAHDAARVRDFAEDRIDERDQPTAGRARALLSASLHAAFQQFSAWPSRNADLNSRIAAAIFTCLNFDSLSLPGGPFGGPTNPWLLFTRLSAATTDAERLINQLLMTDSVGPDH